MKALVVTTDCFILLLFFRHFGFSFFLIRVERDRSGSTSNLLEMIRLPTYRRDLRFKDFDSIESTPAILKRYFRQIRLIKTGEGRIGKEIGDFYLEICLVTSEGFWYKKTKQNLDSHYKVQPAHLFPLSWHHSVRAFSDQPTTYYI